MSSLANRYDASSFSTTHHHQQTGNSSGGGGFTYLNDADKAFDGVVFELLKVDPDQIAGQLTLIDLPLFKALQPDELISCKWNSREKLTKAPNIVQFTRRFNQTTFWCQKEILNCKRIETRVKMITHFIKIAKRLNELHSFNSLMAIIVALRSAPIHRLKKTWLGVAKREVTYFDRLADMMLDTANNKQRVRDLHMNCRLPCIPFLGLFLTDLIHIDIAHPHHSFDNPQRRNQMNNICRLISEYQQSNYQDLGLLDCSCVFSMQPADIHSLDYIHGNDILNNLDNGMMEPPTEPVCLVNNCQCIVHHTNSYGGGIINNDGTMFIQEIKYVKNYLNSFLYIEELQKFKEEELFRDSLELEPDVTFNTDPAVNTSPLALNHYSTSSPGKLYFNTAQNLHHHHQQQQHIAATKTQNLFSSSVAESYTNKMNHRKTQSLATSLFNYEENEPGGQSDKASNTVLPILPTPTTQQQDHNNDEHKGDKTTESDDCSTSSRLRHHPLDDSIVESTTNISNNIITTNEIILINQLTNIKLTKEQQKKLFSSVKLNDPPSLFKELLKFRKSSTSLSSNTSNKSSGFKSKLSCYNANTADLDEDENDDEQQAQTNGITLSRVENRHSNELAGDNHSVDLSSLSHRPDGALKSSSESASHDNSSATMEINVVSPINELTPLFSLVQIESPVKRKCIFKKFHKPKIKKWTSYWLQLIGGNLLLYYPAKSIVFPSSSSTSTTNRRNSVTINNNNAPQSNLSSISETDKIDERTIASSTTTPSASGGLSTNGDSNSSSVKSFNSSSTNNDSVFGLTRKKSLKSNFNKNPCKMHQVANWMVVNLFEDIEKEMTESSARTSLANTTAATTHYKFDIQLNDLNNGNMYKFRFDNLYLAKEWLEKFKAASTYHERQKLDNLIRFD